MTSDSTPDSIIYTAEELMRKRRESVRNRRKERISRIADLIPDKNYFDAFLIPDTNIA